MLKKLDDIVQTILVQRATPDWLPFVPGSSFWVPPRLAPLKVTDLVGKLADQLTDEESLSVATDRGWPCSQFFVHGSGSTETKEVDMEAEGSAEVEVEVEVKVLTESQKPSRYLNFYICMLATIFPVWRVCVREQLFPTFSGLKLASSLSFVKVCRSEEAYPLGCSAVLELIQVGPERGSRVSWGLGGGEGCGGGMI
ncbi:hypothetical protein Prudu_000616 [Prunus dulcis]|uniref:Uncharacterized protein n=1 Tax=Prunus dulcis TaxID=3755 RepID=A0A4Y1QLX6_PRUDU|nr:hypothetical protein Prudu_000616 [Prunus dulcis]